MDGPGDPDRDVFVEYARETDREPENQGWKDSHDAIFNCNRELGHWSNRLILEVQGYVYAAKVGGGAYGFRASGLGTSATELFNFPHSDVAARTKEKLIPMQRYRLLRRRTRGHEKQMGVRSSNAGHALVHRHPLSNDRAAQKVRQILKPSTSFPGGLSARHNIRNHVMIRCFYHNVCDLASRQFDDRSGVGALRIQTENIEPIFDGLLERGTDDGPAPAAGSCFSELKAPQRSRTGPLYPVGCSPQAWSSGALFSHPELDALIGQRYN